MAEWSQSHFDEAVFQAFVKSIGIYPTGSLVRLDSGRLGVVLEQHPKSLTMPRVKVFYSVRLKAAIPVEVIDLAKLAGRDKIVARESSADWPFKNLDELWSGIADVRRSRAAEGSAETALVRGAALLFHVRCKDDPMYRLDWLRNHLQHSDTYALWLYRQFAYEFADQPLEDWQREFAEGQRSGEWQCLVALDGERLLGGAAGRDDLPGRDDLGPWLACVFTTPEARGQGIAERLIQGICEQARHQGHTRLYLHTQDRADYYARRGWAPLELFQAWGAEHT